MANESRSTVFTHGLLLGLIVFALLAVTHRSVLFIQPWHEHSDYAINALQIDRAGQFREIHGNFSRFGFQHPGPAFFYVYALGEQVLFNWLHCVPSRYNAHVVAGTLLQTFFFAMALAVAAHWIRRPLFLPLALLAAAVHFGLAGNTFVEIWPPRVLVMPFLCLLVASASVAAGRVRDLPLLVLAGCFLVHGHVAQPLFVVPISVAACVSLWLRARQRPEGAAAWWRNSRREHVLAFACISLFLLPLAIDLLAGAESNLVRIVEFERFHRGHGKSLWKSLLYLAAFPAYLKEPEKFLPEHQPGRADFIGEYWGRYVVWAMIIAVGLVHLVRLFRRRDAASRAFVFFLAAFIVLTCLLCLRWGVAQVGGMFEFNGHFYYAPLFCILLVFSAAVSALRLPAPRTAGSLLCVLAVAVAWRRQNVPPPIDYSTNQIPAAVESARQADPVPNAPKYLLFGHTNWGEAASAALALHRSGGTFRVNSDWGPRIGDGATFEPAPPDFDLQGVSVWRITYLGPDHLGRVFRDDLRLYFEPLPLDPNGAEIDCGERGNLELYALFGLAGPDGRATWTIRPYVGLIFQSPRVTTDILVSITAEPAAARGEPGVQPMTFSVNGREVFACTLTDRATVTARVPAAVWNLSSTVRLVLHLPNAIPPKKHGPSTEHRTIGWHIERIRFEPAR